MRKKASYPHPTVLITIVNDDVNEIIPNSKNDQLGNQPINIYDHNSRCKQQIDDHENIKNSNTNQESKKINCHK